MPDPIINDENDPADIDPALIDDLDDDDAVVDPLLKVPPKIVDPEEDHESLDALADEEEEEIDADLDDGDSF